MPANVHINVNNLADRDGTHSPLPGVVYITAYNTTPSEAEEWALNVMRYVSAFGKLPEVPGAG